MFQCHECDIIIEIVDGCQRNECDHFPMIYDVEDDEAGAVAVLVAIGFVAALVLTIYLARWVYYATFI